MLEKSTNYTKERKTLEKIESLLEEAYDLHTNLPSELQYSFIRYHNDTSSLPHCLRWGYQAASEILEDWDTALKEAV
jgi:hypothetical protein